MILSDTAVRQRISVMVLAVIILVFGVYCYKVLPRESEPDITIPFVFISTDYKGVSPSDIETSITIPIEKKLKGLEGVKKVHSISSEGQSSISIEFITGTDIDKAIEKVRNKVDEAKNDLPSDMEDDPSVFEVNFSEMPIVIFSLSGVCGNPCLKKIADEIEDEIEAIPGVLDAEISGALEREIRIEINPEKLAYYNIPITAFQRVVSGENQNISGGAIRLGDGRFQLRVPGEFRMPEEIYGLIVGAHDGQPVYLKDLARVKDGFKDETSRSRLNGRESVNIAVKKRAGENIIEITDKIDEILARLSPGWPKGTNIIKVMDKSEDIRTMVADLENNIYSGLALVVLVLLFAMGIRNAILVALAIPFSMLLSYIVLYLMGITLNMVVLFSLVLALGMLVDNAIVIVENIYRYMQQGVSRSQAAMRAASEVAWPVIGSTLTTLAAFFPMIFWPGIMGEFMKYLPITLIITLTASLFVALVINPALASFFMKTKNSSGKSLSSEEAFAAGEKPIEIKGVVLILYAGLLKTALRHRLTVTLSTFLLMIVLFQGWLLVVGLERPVEFFPHIDPKSMYVNIDVPEGTNIDYNDRILKQIEMHINGAVTNTGGAFDDRYKESYSLKHHKKEDNDEYINSSDLENIEYIYARSMAFPTAGSAFEPMAANHVGIQFIDMKDRRIPSSDTLNKIRERIKDVPGGKVTIAEAEQGPPTGAPINIEISGVDFRVLGRLAKEIRKIIEQIPYVEDIRDDYVEGTPSVRVSVDRQKAALFGLTTDSIGFALKTGYNGLNISTYHEGDEDFDITVQLSDPDRRVIDILRELMLPTPAGKLVPLTTVAKIDYSGSLGNVIRINHSRVVTVKANVDETKIPGAVARLQSEELLKKFPIPAGYRIKFTGEFEFQKESEEFLSKTFIIALFLIFLILVAMFNSVSQPFIIMTSVILSLGGVFLGLMTISSPFGIIMTGVGVISLAGVVVNNAIILVDYTNKLRGRGMNIHDAIVAGGATRLRPVLLTAITTILGLIPMVTGVSYDFQNWEISWVSESTQWWRTMAVVVIYGLMLATFLTLVVVPTLYSLFDSFQNRMGSYVESIRRFYWKPYEWLTGRAGNNSK
ncbi:MAG: efflux RND transporter permease subunit [Deltaproteobacteria bacterium]|nr:efflux RND transporter permease subunit [Deltaproteobacteria bacterium]